MSGHLGDPNTSPASCLFDPQANSPTSQPANLPANLAANLAANLPAKLPANQLAIGPASDQLRTIYEQFLYAASDQISLMELLPLVVLMVVVGDSEIGAALSAAKG